MNSTCLYCKKETKDDQKFCKYCGQPTNQCPQCMNFCSLDARFCDKCGTNLLIDISNKQTALEKEVSIPGKPVKAENLKDMRKHITVMFVDMKGSTSAIQYLDPEEARNKLAPILKEMKTAVKHYGGTVIHTLGDGIVVLFGAPITQEDHALRACLAALSMQNSTEAISKDIKIRIGLNSGEVLLEVVGKYNDEYDVSGPVVNLAARMEQTAKPGTIQITRNVLMLAENNIEVEYLGSEAIKGFENKIDVFELKAIKKSKTLFELRNRPMYSSFIGRDMEIKQLDQLFVKATKGMGNVVNIMGPIGQGKSRICYEFIYNKQDYNSKILIACGYSHTQNVFLSPIIMLFRDIIDVENSDKNEINKNIQALVAGLDLPYSFSATLSLLDIPSTDPNWEQLDPVLKHKYIFQTGLGILSGLALQKTLIIILEDLQWIDSESEMFMDMLIRSLEKLPIFLLCTSRPEYQDNWKDRPNHTKLVLNPLHIKTQWLLLKDLLGDDPDLMEIKKKILKDCGGNPFFIEETIKLLITEKIIVGTAHHYRLNTSILLDKIHLPETIYNILQAQIDRLPPLQKQTLQVASVVGEHFIYQWVLKLIEKIDEKELEKIMDELCSEQYIYETSQYPEPEFSFKNTMIQEVSYKNLLISERKILHSRLLTHFEDLYKNPLPNQIQIMANHAYFAEQWDKAFVYYLKAARNAFLLNALKLSLQLYNQVLLSAEHISQNERNNEELIYVHLEISHILIRLGKPAEEEHLSKALELTILNNDIPLQTVVFAFKCNSCLISGNANDAMELAKRAYSLAKKTNSSDALLISNSALLHAYMFTGQYKKLYEIAEEIIRNTPDLGYLPASYRLPLGHLAYIFMFMGKSIEGDFKNMRARLEDWLNSTDVNELSTNAYFVNGGHAIFYYFQGDYLKSRFYLENAMRNAKELDFFMAIPLLASTLGCIHLRQDNFEEGKKYIEQAINIGKMLNFTFLSIFSLVSICDGLLLLGEFEKAREFIDMTLKLYRERNISYQTPCLLRLDAELDLQSDQVDFYRSEQKLKEALQMARESGHLPEVAHCHFAMAKLYQGMRKIELSRQLSQDALKMYQKLEMPYWVDAASKLCQ